MRTFARICTFLGAFLLVAGTVYGVTSHEPAGTTLLLVASVTFWFLVVVARRVVRQADDRPEHAVEEIHVGPTIWPFGFALAAVVIGLGVVISPWLLIPGAVGVVVCAAGWLRDVKRSHAPVAGEGST